MKPNDIRFYREGNKRELNKASHGMTCKCNDPNWMYGNHSGYIDEC